MGRRNYKRLRIELPVTVSGLDTNGSPFTQSASTVEISARGLRLRGISCLRRQRGEPVQVKYKNTSARYRVAWIGEEGTSSQGLLGLEGLDDASQLFADHLPSDFDFKFGPRADTYVVSSDIAPSTSPAIVERCKADLQREERRRHPRFHCSGTASMWEQGQEFAISARVNEVSLGGCYIEMMSPMRLGTSVRLELAVNRRSINLEGIVRYSQPNFGMGVEFTKILPGEAEKLHGVIAEMSGAVASETHGSPAPPPARLLGNEFEDAVLRWFGSHDVLTRQQFLELKEEVAHGRFRRSSTT